MKKYIVEKRETEITSFKAAVAAYEGMTLNPDLNGYNISPTETHEFSSKAEADEFLNAQENCYSYNGSGYGYAIEWWLTESDGEDYDGDYDLCGNSNFHDFKASLDDDPE